MTQVTPLLDSLPWSISSGPWVTIPDRLIALGDESYDGADGPNFLFLYRRDQQPVILGARYHYYVVRFNAQGSAPREVAEIIDAGMVDIPSQ